MSSTKKQLLLHDSTETGQCAKLAKWRKLKAVIKYLCKKGLAPKDFYKDFMKILGNECSSYSTVKIWAAE